MRLEKDTEKDIGMRKKLDEKKWQNSFLESFFFFVKLSMYLTKQIHM